MKRPMDAMLDAVEWVTLPDYDGDDLHATHTGVLRIGNMELQVCQLSNGQRVITQESFETFFDALRGEE